MKQKIEPAERCNCIPVTRRPGFLRVSVPPWWIFARETNFLEEPTSASRRRFGRITRQWQASE